LNSKKKIINKTMNNRSPILPILIFAALMAACWSCRTDHNNESDTVEQQYVAEKNPVDTMILARDTFHRELVSNGTLEALQKAKLRFEISGEIEAIKVENGEFVKKGRLLARLNDYTLSNELRKTRISLEQGKVEFQDVLIGQGYDPRDTASVPDRFLRIARVRLLN